MAGRRIFLALSLAALSAAMIVSVALLAASTLRAQSSPDLGDLEDLDDLLGEATETHRFSFLTYELTHLPNRWLTNIAVWIEEPELDERAILRAWFEEGDERERKAAELLLERLIRRTVSELGLDTPLPLFGAVRLVWPPVDIDISPALAVLAVSRRDEVRLVSTVLLDQRPERPEMIEASVEAGGEWSAWATRVGGVALYPAQVVQGRGFEATLEVAAHEWVHHYLAFYGLGLAYGRSADLRTINETVADIAGDEIAARAASASSFRQTLDDDAVRRWAEIRALTDPLLRQLRIDVDALLADGRVDDAEALMEATRLELKALGRSFRRINQAFLAFSGSYGASPASASDWGPRLFALREQSASLAEFMRRVRGIASRSDADARLPALERP